MITHTCQQGTDEWLRLRAGIPTASEADKILTPKTLKVSASSGKYMARLLAEWIIGQPIIDDNETKWMLRGSELEAQAMRTYSFETGYEVSESGFYTTSDGLVGASPDRLVGDKGLIEGKCPKLENHVFNMCHHDAFVSEHVCQVQTQLFVCSDREWVDLFSYHPALPPVIIRCERIAKFQEALAAAFTMFTSDMLNLRDLLESRYGPFVRDASKIPARPLNGFGVSDEDVEMILAARKGL